MERQLHAIFLSLQNITVLDSKKLRQFIVVWTRENKCKEFFSADIYFSIVLKYVEIYIQHFNKRNIGFNNDPTLAYRVILGSMLLVFVHHSDYKTQFKIVDIPGIKKYNKRYLNLLKNEFLKSINYQIVY